MGTYNPVPAEVIHAALEEMGFARTTVGKEIVYERANHRLPSLFVRVFTSSHVGQVKVAAKGKDAIRIVLVYRAPDGSTRCVKKETRVFRVGETSDILDRIKERSRELYAMANWISTVPPCKKCGAPCYKESGKCVAYCWRNA